MNALKEKQAKGKEKKAMPSLRLELRTFRLWDWRAAHCAKKALKPASLLGFKETKSVLALWLVLFLFSVHLDYWSLRVDSHIFTIQSLLSEIIDSHQM